MIYLISFIAAAFLFSYLTKKKTEEGYLKTVYKTDWHYKLIVWTFRSEPNFKKFCGYWWLAMFCFLCFPLTVLSYFVEWVIDSFFVIWTRKEENKVYRNTPTPIKIEKVVCEKQRAYVEKWTGYLRYLVKPFLILSAIGAAYLIYLILGNAAEAISLSDLISAVIIVACVGAAAFIVRKAWEWMGALRQIVKEKTVTEEKESIVPKIFAPVAALVASIVAAFKKECPIMEIKESKE